jgi:hypothetical protein
MLFMDAYPYFNPILWGLRPVAAPGLGTMAVDSHGRWYVDCDAVDKWPIEEVIFALAHEVTHVVCRHPQRATPFLDEIQVYLDACDLADNSWVGQTLPDANAALRDKAERAGSRQLRKVEPVVIRLMDDILLPKKFGLPEGQTAEEYTVLLRNNAKYKQYCDQRDGTGTPSSGAEKQGQGQPSQQGGAQAKSSPRQPAAKPAPGQQPQKAQASGSGSGSQSDDDESDGQGGGGGSQPKDGESDGQGGVGGGGGWDKSKPHIGHGHCGSCAGGGPAPWELPAPEEGGPDGLTPSEIQIITRSVAEAVVRHCKSRGVGLGSLERWATDELGPPRIRWEARLRSMIRARYDECRGYLFTSWRRPSRRSRDIYFPGLVSPIPVIAICVDTSGSMGSVEITEALTEVKGVLRACGGVTQHLVSGDMGLRSHNRASDVRKIKLVGGGGTSMATMIHQALELKPKPNLIIVMTDGYTDVHDRTKVPRDIRVIYVLVGPSAQVPADWVDIVRTHDK